MRIIEGTQFLYRFADGTTAPQLGGANAIALSPDGKRLYYGPFASRRLYSVDTAKLLDPAADDAAVAATIVDLGDKGATAGIIADSKDRIYLSMQEFNAVARRELDGTITMLDSDDRLSWPDTFWITDDGWLYVTAAQGHLLPFYNREGKNLQKPPFAIMRMRIDAGPAWG
jgi:sugar lactone lactonase YvrE